MCSILLRDLVTEFKYIKSGFEYVMVRIIQKSNLEEINIVEGEWFKLKECFMIPSGRFNSNYR